MEGKKIDRVYLEGDCLEIAFTDETTKDQGCLRFRYDPLHQCLQTMALNPNTMMRFTEENAARAGHPAAGVLTPADLEKLPGFHHVCYSN